MNVVWGLKTGGGSTTTFGAGTFNIGAGTSACNDGGTYSICHTGSTLTFGGPSTFNLAAGIYNSGGETITFGSGTTNSFNIGPASNGNAIYVGGGAVTTFADATGAGDLFQMVGKFQRGRRLVYDDQCRRAARHKRLCLDRWRPELGRAQASTPSAAISRSARTAVAT